MSFLKIKNCIFKIIIELFVLDKQKRSRYKARWAKLNLKKYTDFAINNLSETNFQESIKTPNIIWQYWQQGFDNAPILIKKCIESTKKYHPDKKINLLNIQNIKDYVEIPARYYDLLAKGKICCAHFSDIVRTYLLFEYGGLWADSTIFFTGKIPDNIFKADFFVLSKDEKEDWMENVMSNFFIYSKPKNKIIKTIKITLDKYWKENDFAFNYFMYEHIVTLLVNGDILKENWKKMPYYSALDSGILQKIMNEDYSEKIFDEIKVKTSIHKLSYKKIKDCKNPNSYYEKIIKGDI